MKRLVFFTTFDYPSRYAHAIHGLHMARAFHAALGERFCFIVNIVQGDSLAGIPFLQAFGQWGRVVKTLHLRRTLAPLVLRRFFARRAPWCAAETILFSNDPSLIGAAAIAAKQYGVSFVYECHGTLDDGALELLARSARKIIFTTQFLEQAALTRVAGLAGKTLVLPNAVDIAAFGRVTESKDELRQKLGLPHGFLIGYVGRFTPLQADKGLALMIDALADLPVSVRLALIGGTKDEIDRYRVHAENSGLSERVTFVPHVSSDLVPSYEKACDVLAYVPPGGSSFFEKETSPMKVFEYMAAGRPMIVSDLPTIRAIAAPDEAFFVSPGDHGSYARAVMQCLTDPQMARERASRAFARVAENTWERRASRILAA